MNRRTAFLLLLTLIGCDPPKSTDAISAEQIIKRSIERHGGQFAWNNLESIAYQKTTILFDSSGIETSRITQHHRFKLKPELSGTIKWAEKTDSITITYQEGKATRYVNQVEDTTSGETSKNVVMASLYVLFQPFKLMDEGTQLEYVAMDTLDGIPVHTIRPVYAGAQPGDDEWLFYVNATSDVLIANRVNHQGRLSHIRNLEFDSTSKFVLHKHRKSYFVDSLMREKRLVAAYYYAGYNLAFRE